MTNNDLLTPLLAWLAEASLVLAAVIPAILLVRHLVRHRISARWTYALWLAVPLALAASLAPRGLIEVPAAPAFADLLAPAPAPRRAAPPSAALQASSDAPAESVAPAGDAASALADRTSAPAAGAAPAALCPTSPLLLLALWLAGALGLAAAHVQAQRRFHRLVAAPARRPDADERAALAAGGAQASDIERTRLSALLAGPVVYGALRPRLLLPESFLAASSADERRVVLAHEAEHIRAGHLWHRAAARAVRAAFWFHPCAWIAERALVADQELACDEAALARDPAIRRQTYAAALLSAAERIAAQPAPAGGASLVTPSLVLWRTRMIAHAGAAGPSRRAGLATLAVVAGLAAAAGLAGCLTREARADGAGAAAVRDGAAIDASLPRFQVLPFARLSGGDFALTPFGENSLAPWSSADIARMLERSPGRKAPARPPGVRIEPIPEARHCAYGPPFEHNGAPVWRWRLAGGAASAEPHCVSPRLQEIPLFVPTEAAAPHRP